MTRIYTIYTRKGFFYHIITQNTAHIIIIIISTTRLLWELPIIIILLLSLSSPRWMYILHTASRYPAVHYYTYKYFYAIYISRAHYCNMCAVTYYYCQVSCVCVCFIFECCNKKVCDAVVDYYIIIM